MTAPGIEPDHRTLAIQDFAVNLVAHRMAARMTQEELGALTCVTAGQVGHIERARRAPSIDFAEACDRIFETGGSFRRQYEIINGDGDLKWFDPWIDEESGAAQLWLWEHSLVPGLLQTEDYARAVLRMRPGLAPEDVEEDLGKRLKRQAILSRPHPPRLWVVVGEVALTQVTGDAKVMHGQMVHLAQASELPNVCIQVVPASVGYHCALSGAFALAQREDGSRVAYLEGISRGQFADSLREMDELTLMFDSLRAETLSQSASREFIRRQVTEWT